ncbi:alpha/beta fold hydrolase [Pokkaliibacter sp. MBI-7]|uniref:thioesterase II family protein n=1 Tax=Pokkaliibacter sp. MBI-7 TaxID=3040600 RepID=UPI00244971CD|nr:alpha/beta fold hydrolase [Pokkaliibacter sp. MBI-7]MDH2433771.1 alpha/beta fold hydrolase [Pokkaliibacter sp. MBI-7]
MQQPAVIPTSVPLTLYCLPCAGGSAAMYFRWRRALAPHIELVPVELPGRGSRIGEDFVRHFETLVSQLADELAAGLPARYAFFGHSMGTLLAYGLCRELQQRGLPAPQALLMSAGKAPRKRDTDRFLHLQSDAELIADLQRQGGTPAALFDEPELLQMAVDTLAADYQVCGSFAYAGSAGLNCPLHVLAGREDEITEAELQAWAAESSGPMQLNWFDGGHFYLKGEEQAVLALIRQQLLPDALHRLSA